MPTKKGSTGIEWFYEVEGGGETLLFLHGWGVDRRIWRQQTKHFCESYQVISIDLPGHGQSSFVHVSMEEMVKDIGVILNDLGLDNITLIGSSLGGLFGLKLYSTIPEKFKRLVFVGSMPKFSQSEDYPYGLDIKRIRKLNGQLDTAYPSIVDIFFRSLFTQEERESRRFKWLQKFRKTDSKPIKKALAEYLSIMEKEDLRQELRKVTVPMQFINGREDQICCAKTTAYLQGILPHARFDFFENCGHFPFLSKPYEFNEMLERFLKET
ncbi:MAG: alpha/beta fold hydrolase [Candidatus Omnitrophica bacterium]|nr:alpha/beta fold hydrolase [Candidatus Omnitrophota bacterium]